MQARKYLKIFFIITLTGLVSFLGFNIVKRAMIKQEAADKVQTLPDFEFYTLDDQPFKKASLQAGLPVAIILFNSECDHCQYGAAAIRQKLSLFKGIQVLMISSQETSDIKAFAEQYEFIGKQEITMLRDKKRELLNKLGTEVVPTIFVYDKTLRLAKKYVGETKPEAILKAANLM